jgi:hypothetical protein
VAKKGPDSNIASTFAGLNGVLLTMAVLNLPEKRRRQLLQPSPLPLWARAIHTVEKAGIGAAAPAAAPPRPSRWLVAGLGVGATLISTARVASNVTFVGVDSSHAVLSRILRDSLTHNSVKIAFGSNKPTVSTGMGTSAVSPLKLAGLARLRRKVAVSTEAAPVVSAREDTRVYLQRGCLEAFESVDGGTCATSCAASGAQEEGTVPEQKFHALVLDPEFFDDGLIGKRVLPSIRNAHKNLLEPNATVLPRAARMRAAVIQLLVTPDKKRVFGVDTTPIVERYGWSVSYESFNLAQIATSNFASSSTAFAEPAFSQGHSGLPWTQLSEEFDVWSFNFQDGNAMLKLPRDEMKPIVSRMNSSGAFCT